MNKMDSASMAETIHNLSCQQNCQMFTMSQEYKSECEWPQFSESSSSAAIGLSVPCYAIL